jgi:hypothetical protein
MNTDQYLFYILGREAVPTGADAPAMVALNTLHPAIQAWAGNALLGVVPSGSFAKGTGNKSGTDIDLFISLSQNTTATLRDVYNSLYGAMHGLGYQPTKQNVSINVRVNGFSVDLVPSKRQDNQSTDHSLYRRKADTWMQTNVHKHIAHVRAAKRINETRILKLWRKQKGIELPSFYLELTVIDALRGTSGHLSDQVRKSLEYIRDDFTTSRVVDPANTNNIVSDDLTAAEKQAVKSAAIRALSGTWSELVS